MRIKRFSSVLKENVSGSSGHKGLPKSCRLNWNHKLLLLFHFWYNPKMFKSNISLNMTYFNSWKKPNNLMIWWQDSTVWLCMIMASTNNAASLHILYWFASQIKRHQSSQNLSHHETATFLILWPAAGDFTLYCHCVSRWRRLNCVPLSQADWVKIFGLDWWNSQKIGLSVSSVFKEHFQKSVKEKCWSRSSQQIMNSFIFISWVFSAQAWRSWPSRYLTEIHLVIVWEMCNSNVEQMQMTVCTALMHHGISMTADITLILLAAFCSCKTYRAGPDEPELENKVAS